MLDRPTGRKSHPQAVPYLGGVAIVLSFVAAAGLVAAVAPLAGANFGALAMTLGLGAGLAGLGLLDDLLELPILTRLVVEIAAAVVICVGGTRADLRAGPSYVDWVVTILWIVGITNAFNLLDNLDGLSAGVASMVALALAGVGLANDQYFVPLLALALAGCAAGFLRHNFHPARIHMGDAGSLFLGFVLAVLALRLRSHVAHQVSFAVPLVAMAVPIFDTTLVVACRAWHHRNPFRGYTDHVSHRLVRLGWSVPEAVTAIYVLAAACGALAVSLTHWGRTAGLAAAGALAVCLLVVGGLLARVPVYPDPEPASSPPGQRRSTS